MLSALAGSAHPLLAAGEMPGWLYNTLMGLKVLIGFSIIIFVHELGHFLAAKWVGIRVDRFSIGFGPRLFGYRRGEGFTLGRRPDYSADELAARRYGETDYCFKALPIGGYVKMLGQDDVIINEQTGAVTLSDDPRAFTNKPVGRRMIVVSAGVVFNLLFAALLLMIVFLVGKRMPAPVIGLVEPGTPAQGLLQPGDRVLEIDGRRVDSFMDIRLGVVLGSADEVRLKIERDGEVLTVDVPTAGEDEQGLPTLGVDPMLTTEVAADVPPVGNLPSLRRGDVITHVDGQPVANAYDVYVLFTRSRGRTLKLTVQRPDPDDPQRKTTVECYQRARLLVSPATLEAVQQGRFTDASHILGLRRRLVVGLVAKRQPAEKAGFQPGDVIARWGAVLNPTYEELLASIRANDGRPIPVVVERDGQVRELTVTPRRPFRLFGRSDPKVGLEFSLLGAEEDKPVVADVAPDTPFAALNIPRGALLLEVDGRPVSNWFDVVELLKAAAGRTIEVRYRAGNNEGSGQVSVPSSLVNELNLPPGALVWSVDGQGSVTVRRADGKEVELPVRGSPLALQALLRSKIGKEVTIRYSRSFRDEPVAARFRVRADNYDPWQLRISYTFDPRIFEPQTELVSAHGNPIRALKMGINATAYQVWQVYRFLTKLVSRSISTQAVAGPVGIIGIAFERAKMGTAELLFFLAFLSVNLAVLNFLPVPVLDGGLMIFLIIEKIKGTPLSMKAQIVSTMVGLAAIIIGLLFATIQDIGRFF